MSKEDRTWLVKLRDMIDNLLSMDEIHELCFELDIDFEQLPGDTKRLKIQSLIGYQVRREQLPELSELLKIKRPNVEWPEGPTSSEEPTFEVQMIRQISIINKRLEEVERKLHERDIGKNITQDQASQISQAVKAVAMALSKRTGHNEYGGVYGELYRKYHITSYRILPAAKFESAMAWLNEWYQQVAGEDWAL